MLSGRSWLAFLSAAAFGAGAGALIGSLVLFGVSGLTAPAGTAQSDPAAPESVQTAAVTVPDERTDPLRPL